MTEAIARENGRSTFAVDIDVSGFNWIGDEPEASGGANLGPAPYDLLTAALAECTSMTVRWYAARQKWPVEHVSTRVIHEKRDGKDHFIKFVTIAGPDLSEQQRARLLDVANKCPVHRTLQSQPGIDTAWETQV